MLLINEYIKKHRLEIFSLIKDKSIIYLDTKFWLILRDQNRETNPEKRLLLDKILELSDSGKCVFPISEISFWEFLKQKDIVTLKETVTLVDRLSQGITIINTDERYVLELEHFFLTKSKKETYEIKELIWTKLHFILGYNFISGLKLESEQKSFFDFLTILTLEKVFSIANSNNINLKTFEFKDDIELLNSEKEKYMNDNKSYKQMFLSELGGHLDLHEHIFDDVIYSIYCKEKNLVPNDSRNIERDENKNFKNLVYRGFENGSITDELPVFRIVPELYASVRWNTGRKYKDGNDTMDFLHASFALPYCDYFFTEHELKTIITQTKLDVLYVCQVESRPKIILEILEKINKVE